MPTMFGQRPLTCSLSNPAQRQIERMKERSHNSASLGRATHEARYSKSYPRPTDGSCHLTNLIAL